MPDPEYEFIDLEKIDIPGEVLFAVDPRLARNYRFVPVRTQGDGLVVAFPDIAHIRSIDRFKHRLFEKTVIPVLAGPSAIDAALEKYYPESANEAES